MTVLSALPEDVLILVLGHLSVEDARRSAGCCVAFKRCRGVRLHDAVQKS